MTEMGLGHGRARGPKNHCAGGVSDSVHAAVNEVLSDDRILRMQNITVEHGVSTGDDDQLVLDWGSLHVSDDAIVQRLTVFARRHGGRAASEDTARALLVRATAVLTNLQMPDRQPLVRVELREIGTHRRVFDVRYQLPTRAHWAKRPVLGGQKQGEDRW